MGCITKHYLNKETVIGVWKIEEDLETLLSMVEMGPEDLKRYELFRSNYTEDGVPERQGAAGRDARPRSPDSL